MSRPLLSIWETDFLPAVTVLRLSEYFLLLATLSGRTVILFIPLPLTALMPYVRQTVGIMPLTTAACPITGAVPVVIIRRGGRLISSPTAGFFILGCRVCAGRSLRLLRVAPGIWKVLRAVLPAVGSSCGMAVRRIGVSPVYLTQSSMQSG